MRKRVMFVAMGGTVCGRLDDNSSETGRKSGKL